MGSEHGGRGLLHVVGGGLAGSEAAWQAAEQGVHVALWEMRPKRMTPAHVTHNLAELVCSNSLGSDLPDRAAGILKRELRQMGSLIMTCADEVRVPAGGALAVGRESFSELVTERIEQHPNIELFRGEVTQIPDEPAIIATGPLTSNALADDIGRLIGQDYLYFYDALAPIIRADSIDMTVAFRASRYDRGDQAGGDYINCPMDEKEYRRFVEALLTAERIQLRQFEAEDPAFFEGCLPVEEIAGRGEDSLAYGPLRPVGLRDPQTGERPYAVVQLRQDNIAGSLYNMVGFQTNLRWPEQRRVFRLIPGLENAEFVRLGQMHRNTFLNSPVMLRPTLQYRDRDDLFFAGQIIGVEGYVGNAGTGLLAGLNAARVLQGRPLLRLPKETMLGALTHYICTADSDSFQPMKANMGILPELVPHVRNKRERYATYSQRAEEVLHTYLEQADNASGEAA